MVRSFSNLRVFLISLGSLEHLRLAGGDGTTFAVGDCTATAYAPTAQVASQQGSYLARILNKSAKRDVLNTKLEALQAESAGDESTKKIENLKRELEKVSEEKVKPFKYSHQGSLA